MLLQYSFWQDSLYVLLCTIVVVVPSSQLVEIRSLEFNNFQTLSTGTLDIDNLIVYHIITLFHSLELVEIELFNYLCKYSKYCISKKFLIYSFTVTYYEHQKVSYFIVFGPKTQKVICTIKGGLVSEGVYTQKIYLG